MACNKSDVFWMRQDVLGNFVRFYVRTWEIHAEKHAFDKIPSTPEHIYQAVTDPDFAHRSLDPAIGSESCIFEKFFEPEQQRFFVPVLYEGVDASGDYDQGGKNGKVLSGFFLEGMKPSRMIGEVFWSKDDKDSGKPEGSK